MHLSEPRDLHACLLVGSAALLQALPNLKLQHRGWAAVAALRRAAQLLRRTSIPALVALRQLNLRSNRLGVSGATALAAVLPQLPAIQQLHLGHTVLTLVFLRR